MHLRSQGAVSDPNSVHTRLSFLLPLIAGATVMCLVGLLAKPIAQVIDAAWFGLEQLDGGPGVLWISLFLVSAALYGLVRGLVRVASSFFDVARINAVVSWVRSFLAFLALLYWIVGIHFIIVIEGTGDRPPVWLWCSVFELLMVSSLAALVWPLAFGLRSHVPTRAIFLLSLTTLGPALVILDPDVVTVVLASLGVIEPPRSLLLGGSFSALPYLAPVAPTLWAAFDSWRGTAQGGSTRFASP